MIMKVHLLHFPQQHVLIYYTLLFYLFMFFLIILQHHPFQIFFITIFYEFYLILYF